jgi:hypothetical protein
MDNNPEQPTHCEQEVQILDLLSEIQKTLENAIGSLAHKKAPSWEANYLGWAASFASTTAEGYLVLRKNLRVDASKILVRPLLEVLFSTHAVMSKPGAFFQLAWDEITSDKQSRPSHEHPYMDAVIKQLEKELRQRDSNYPIVTKKYSIFQRAKDVKLQQIYEGPYRTYCKYTHGAQIAVQGHLDESTHPFDSWWVAYCILEVLLLLKKHTPADIPELAPFQKRLTDHFCPP